VGGAGEGLGTSHRSRRNGVRTNFHTKLVSNKGKNYNNTELGKAEKQTRRYLENCVKVVLEEEEVWDDFIG